VTREDAAEEAEGGEGDGPSGRGGGYGENYRPPPYMADSVYQSPHVLYQRTCHSTSERARAPGAHESST